MIAVVYGTTGEIIKLAPVLLTLSERGIPFLGMCTGQQRDKIPSVLDQFGLPQPDVWLGEGHRHGDLERKADVPLWLARNLARFVRSYPRLRRELREGRGRPIVLIHGDTMTTVLGGLMGRALRVDVGHIEAGMRSHDWRNPFPEELNRRLAAHLATVHFAPGELAVANLRHIRKPVLDTHLNTVRDAFDMAPEVDDERVPSLPAPFGLVSLHRHELIDNRDRFTEIISHLSAAAARSPMYFVDHTVTATRIRDYGLEHFFTASQLVRIPKLQYFAFITLLKRAAFVVTDSGGLQDECAFLDKPCLLHRQVTESVQGLGGSVVLSNLDLGVVDDFLAMPECHSNGLRIDNSHPSQIVVDYLQKEGFTS